MLGVIIAIIGFGFLIFIHEMGHLLAAKATGITVNEFAIGFGPTLFHFNLKETKYSLKLIPFGGFCAMEGEDSQSESSGAFGTKPIWKRAIVLVAGAAANIIFGLVIMGVMLSQAESFSIPTVETVIPSSYAEQAQLQPGDQILSINKRKVFSVNDVAYEKYILAGKPMHFTVERDGNRVKLPDTVVIEQDEKIGITFASVDNSFTETIKQTFLQTASMCNLIYQQLFDLITGKIPVKELSGPVGVTAAATTSLENGGFRGFTLFLVFISINLGVVNLLPFPALDGGRLAFLGIEAVRRKPVPPKYEAIVNGVGFILLFGLIILVTGKDIYRLIFK